jgi:hypothetical protein
VRKFNLEASEQHFNLLWRSLIALEKNLLKIIEENADDSDGELAAFAGNDLVYLRLYKDDLEKAAKEAKFSDNVFSLSDEVIET